MKAVLFCRVSSKEQEETGFSLPAQEKLLKEYRDKHGFDSGKIFSISESASGKRQRTIFEEMMRYVEKNNISIIICEKVDRLTRNFKDAVVVNDWLNENSERQVHFVKESVVLSRDSKSNEKFIWNIKVSVAQYHIDNLSEEVKKGQKEKLSQGWLPTTPPVGYKTIGTQGHKIHVIDPSVAPLVKKLFELYASGDYSLTKLTKRMEEEGLRNREGNGKLFRSQIYRLLTDPFYIGQNRWNDKITPGKQEWLVSEELFQQVQQLLKRKAAPKYRRHNFLFKSLFHCGECGGGVTWEIHKGIVYGHCNHYHNCKQDTWYKEKDIDSLIGSVLSTLEIRHKRLAEWIGKALKAHHQLEMDCQTVSQQKLQETLALIQNRLDKIYDDRLDGKITEDFFSHKFQQYTEEKEAIVNNIKRKSEDSNRYMEMGITYYELSQRASEIYQNSTTEIKRGVLRQIFEPMVLKDGKIECKFKKAFQALSDAIKATNSSKLKNVDEKLDKTFEPNEKMDLWEQMASFYAHRPIWLERWNDYRTLKEADFKTNTNFLIF